jgi:hypothetical protein
MERGEGGEPTIHSSLGPGHSGCGMSALLPTSTELVRHNELTLCAKPRLMRRSKPCSYFNRRAGEGSIAGISRLNDHREALSRLAIAPGLPQPMEPENHALA